MKKIISVMALLIMLVLQGCGTVMYGSRQDMTIDSTPSGATVTVANYKVMTPATVSLSRLNDYMLTMEKEGYVKTSTPINRSFNGGAVILGNILWLLPGAAIDLVAGGAWTLTPENVSINLYTDTPEGRAASEADALKKEMATREKKEAERIAREKAEKEPTVQ